MKTNPTDVQTTRVPTAKEAVLPVRSALKRIRAAYDITQGRMCELLGYQHTYLSKIENGKSPLTLEFVTRIASQFGGCDPEVWKLAEYLAESEKRAMKDAVRRAIAQRTGAKEPASEGPPS